MCECLLGLDGEGRCRVNGKSIQGNSREQRAGDKIQPYKLLFLWMCSDTACFLGIWCYFDSGDILFNPYKSDVLGYIYKCSFIKISLRPLSP